MDPNAALAKIRNIISDYNADNYDDAEQALSELAEHIDGLDEWLSEGGFLPKAWAR